MAHLQTIHLAHLPPDLAIHIAQYTNLRNASHLHAQLLAGDPDFEYAFIDAHTVLSPTHLLAAVWRACNDKLNHRLKSRNVHSEIVFALGCTNNIASTLKAFGIKAGTTDLIAVKVGLPGGAGARGEDVERHLAANVEGEMVGFGETALVGLTDLALVRKLYKISPVGAVGVGGGGKESKLERRRRLKEGLHEGSADGGEAMVETSGKRMGDEEAERRELEVQVLGLMALRGAM